MTLLYPRPPREAPSHRRWRVAYDLAYDGGGAYWNGYYRTRIGALISTWWNVHISSWGGSALLIDQTKYRANLLGQ